MSWSSSFLVAALTGALGLVATGVITTALNDWFHLFKPGDVGGGLLTVIITVVGGLACFVFGLVVSRTLAGTPEPGIFRPLGISCGAVIAMGGTVLLVGWFRADLPPKIDGQAIALAVEVRAPAGFSVPKVASDSDAIAGVRAAGSRVGVFGHLDLTHAKKVDGRWIITALVALGTSSKRKVMEVRIGQGTDLTFQLPLAAHPSRDDMEWSAWLDSDAGAGQTALPPEQKFNLRYQVKFVALTGAEIVAQQAAEEQATFDALGAATPIPDWFAYTEPGAPAARLATAVKHITSRPNYVAKLAALMVGDNDDRAKAALELVPHLPPPQPALLAPVAAAGRDLASRIRAVNANAAADDPHPSGGHSAALRFTAWMTAVRALRETSGGDFTSELGEILVLSRLRPKTVLLQDSVRGVASHAMKQWANVEPLPGDPPRR